MRRGVIVGLWLACSSGDRTPTPEATGSGIATPVGASADSGSDSGAAGAAMLDAGPLRILDMKVGTVVLSDGRIRKWGGPTATPRESGRVPGARAFDRGIVVLADGGVVETRWGDGVITSSTRRPKLANVVRATHDRTGSTRYFVHADGTLTVEKPRRSDKKTAEKTAAVVASLTGVVEAVAGNCILDRTGTVACFSSLGVELVRDVPPARHLVEFLGTVCALGKTGGVYCFDHSNRRVREVTGFEEATALAADVRFGFAPLVGLMCAIVDGGQVACSKVGSSESRIPRIDPPVRIAGLRGATRIDVDVSTACAETPRGIACWGENNNGQVGDGTRIDRDEPALVEHLLADTLPPPRDGFDAVPESATKMSWRGLPTACAPPATFSYRGRDAVVTFEVASGYAWWNRHRSLVVRIASYHTEPARALAQPRGRQMYATLRFDRFTRDRVHRQSDRGTYVLDVEGDRELGFGYREAHRSWSAKRGSQQAELRYLDTTWACGTFEYAGEDLPRSNWAARLLPEPVD
jgi:hypothetical protein